MTRRLLPATAASFLLLALSACGTTTVSQPGAGTTDRPAPATASPAVTASDLPTPQASDMPAPSPAATTDANGAQRLAAAEKRWREHALSSYRFTYRPGCFCPRVVTRVSVIDGRVTAVKAVKDVDNAADRPVPPLAETPTVDKLFSVLHVAYEGDGDEGAKPAAEVDATYDDTYGFPVAVRIDWDKLAMDEETGYTIDHFVGLPEPSSSR